MKTVSRSLRGIIVVTSIMGALVAAQFASQPAHANGVWTGPSGNTHTVVRPLR